MRRLARHALDGAVSAAQRRVRRELPRLGPLWPQLRYHRYDLGDNIARFLQNDRITDANILFLYEIFVVQGRAGDRGARDRDRAQMSDRGELPRPPHLQHDVLEHRLDLLRRELIRDGEARCLTGIAEDFLLRVVLNLQHDPVELIIELLTRIPFPLLPEREHLVERIGVPVFWIDREAECSEICELCGLHRYERLGGLCDVINEYLERALSRDGGVKLADGAGGGVPRIRELRFALLLAHGIQAREAGAREVHFSF